MAKKDTACGSCDDLRSRLDRLEQRLDRAEDDATHWKKRWEVVDGENRQLRGEISLLKHANNELQTKLDDKTAQLKHAQKLLFDEKSEVSETPHAPPDDADAQDAPKRNVGKQPGAKGSGRKRRTELPAEEVEHDVPDSDKVCSSCGAERVRSDFCEESEEITYQMKLVRIRHKRLKYKRSCKCKDTREFVTAPVPAKLIPKGLFTTDFWAFVILEKFLLQRPMSKICYSLSLEGLQVSSGTLTGGLRTLTKLFAPLYKAIREEVRRAPHWHMDETHWRVYTDEVGKENHKWWLWVAETKTATLFMLDPSRSAKVPKALLKDIPAGILSSDRYSAYKALHDGIQPAYCWAHVRRDFLNIREGYDAVAPAAQSWVEKIDDLFQANKARGAPDGERLLQALMQQMLADATHEVALKTTAAPLKAALTSMLKHWVGLTVFLDFPEVPMDNNAAERALRTPVVGRKNYYGSRSIWSGYLSAMLFSLFATLRKHDIDPRLYLTKYLQACAVAGGQPPQDLSPFLPWKLSAEELAALSARRPRAMVH